jgi:opacity protein-like surface antigen
MTVPVSDYHATPNGQGFNTAWQGLALIALKPPSLPVGLRVDATYSANSANDRLKTALTTALGRPSDEKTKLLGASLSAWYESSSPARVKPYVIGGIGLYHTTISVSTGDSTTDNAATKLAWNLGGGLVCGLRGMALFFEARYVNVAAVSGFPRTTFLPITAGVRFGGR